MSWIKLQYRGQKQLNRVGGIDTILYIYTHIHVFGTINTGIMLPIV